LSGMVEQELASKLALLVCMSSETCFLDDNLSKRLYGKQTKRARISKQASEEKKGF